MVQKPSYAAAAAAATFLEPDEEEEEETGPDEADANDILEIFAVDVNVNIAFRSVDSSDLRNMRDQISVSLELRAIDLVVTLDEVGIRQAFGFAELKYFKWFEDRLLRNNFIMNQLNNNNNKNIYKPNINSLVGCRLATSPELFGRGYTSILGDFNRRGFGIVTNNGHVWQVK